MGCLRPATPGFIVTLVATVLLAIVSFCVPYFKSVFFLKALFSADGHSGEITFGTLGYCLTLDNGTSCSHPSVGYSLDVNSLVGDNIKLLQIPQVAVKWLTYALVLHIVALALAAGSAVFGLLAHVREMAMTCCSTCVSGFAAAVALLAFIFDLAFFFIAKSRINAVKGGSAEIGNAIWLTLAAWIMLFFSGCFYTLGRCCISNRSPRGTKKDDWQSDTRLNGVPGSTDRYADQMRLDAVKAEADRKARQKQVEGGLPAFYETQPLTGRVEGDNIYFDDDPKTPGAVTAVPALAGAAAAGGGRRQASQPRAHTGYVQGAAGTRAVDEYYNPTAAAASYPPQPQQRRQGSGHTTNYAPSTYDNYATNQGGNQQYAQQNAAAGNNYLYPGYSQQPQNAGYHGYEASGGSAAGAYGHTQGGTSYHSAVEHQQYPSTYSTNQPYGDATGGFGTETYNNTGAFLPVPTHSPSPAASPRTTTYSNYNAQPYIPSPAPSTPSFPAHQATLPTPAPHSYATTSPYGGGDGYGANSLPPLAEHDHLPSPSYHQPQQQDYTMPGGSGLGNTSPTSPVRGPRSQRPPSRVMSPEQYTDSPPVYEAMSSYVPPPNEKR